MNRTPSQWLTEEVSRIYLEDVRGAIPCAQTQIEILLKIVQAWRPSPNAILDLGCGDGVLGRSLMDVFPAAEAVFADFSDPMLAALREKLGTNDRAILLKIDYSSPDWTERLENRDGWDVVVSGFSIHHQPDSRKRELYAEIHDLLAPGGVFLNLEHVASATPNIEAVFDDYFVDHLYGFHGRSDPEKGREEIEKEYYSRPDKEENILAPVTTQCDWLDEIGFVDVDCFFKVFELALFGGRKAAKTPRV